MSSLAIKTQDVYTYADYMGWSEDKRWELIDGEAYSMSPSPADSHQEPLGALYAEIRQFLKGKPCKVYIAPFDVRLPKYPDQKDADIKDVVQPDLVVLCDLDKLDKRGLGIRGVPDLVVEVLSPSTMRRDLKTKFELYEQHGVREYWVVYPNDQTIQIFKWFPDTQKYGRPDIFCGDDHINTSDVLTGLDIDMREVFPIPRG